VSSAAVQDARLGLLYHCVWDQVVARETFARWSRADFVEYTAVAEAVQAYDRTPDACEGGVDRVVGISEQLHQWMVIDQNWRREHARWAQGHLDGEEPKNPLHARTAVDADVAGGPIFEYRRLAGATLRDGKFAHVVAPGKPWISRTTPEQLHQVLQVDANRREAIADRVRNRQMVQGEHEAAATLARDEAIDWAPIESAIHAHLAARHQVVGA